MEKIYTCPMHPEVKSDKPGRCPKCGMELIPINEKPKLIMSKSEDRGLGVLTWQSYVPLVVIILMITAVSVIVSRSEGISDFIMHFMTGFFLVFAGFKLMDLKGFAEGYSTYDLLAQKFFSYGYIYPFIELGFGLSMLAGIRSPQLLWIEVLVMGFSGLGVMIKLIKKEEIKCVCLGTFLKVPLTYITIIEDFGMMALALILIFLSA